MSSVALLGSFEENRKRSEFCCLALKRQGSFKDNLEQSALKTFLVFRCWDRFVFVAAYEIVSSCCSGPSVWLGNTCYLECLFRCPVNVCLMK